jgi:glycosyltransferase involved in cell wall biosynthesis
VIFSSSDNLTRDGRYPYRPSWFYRNVERASFRSCAGGVAISDEVEEVLRTKGYRGPVEVIPHGVDLKDYPERTGEASTARVTLGVDPPVVGYVGRLLHQKGVETLLGAFAEVRPAPGGARPSLVLVGDGPDREELVRIAGAAGVGDRARFMPGVPHDRVAAIYRAIDVLVVPSRTTPKWKEQFGRVLIEGMAAGCAVIGSSSGAIPSVVGDAGLIFPEDDAPALAAAIGRALHEPGLAATLRARGRERVRARFTWDAVAGKAVRFYDRVMREA